METAQVTRSLLTDWDPTAWTPMERAQAGAEFLDEHCPGWEQRINMDTLRMSSCFDCVLGQLYGRYWEGAALLGPLSRGDAYRYGFAGWSGEYSLLTAHWREQVKERMDRD